MTGVSKTLSGSSILSSPVSSDLVTTFLLTRYIYCYIILYIFLFLARRAYCLNRNTIFNKYIIIGKLGTGGMSKVYLSYDIFLKKKWAVKVINKSNQDYLQEARIMKDLSHPLLPRIVEILEDRDSAYIVMDYIEGISLNNILKKKTDLNRDKIIVIFRELADILIYLHSRKPPIIHGDIKPGNIILTDTGVRLIDFGIALKGTVDYSNNSFGSKGYIAPEILRGKKKSIKSDIYSLGMCMYLVINGKFPSDESVETKRFNGVQSHFLQEIIEKCTCKSPKDRYSSVKELRNDLIKYQTVYCSGLSKGEQHNTYTKEDKQYFAGKNLCKCSTGFFNTVLSKGNLGEKIKYRIYLAAIISFTVIIVFFRGFLSINILDKTSGDSKYERLIFTAKTTANMQDRQNIYSSITEKYPGNTDVYFLIIQDIKSDLCFTLEEEKFLIQKLNINLNNIKTSDKYGELLYSIGRLYWFYYDNESITGKISASFWFEEAKAFLDTNSKEYGEASVCADIGMFYQDINTNIKEYKDKGTYGDLFEKLESLWEIAEAENDNTAGFEAVRIYSGLINAYCEEFLRDGIDKEQMMALYKKYNLILINSKYINKDLILVKDELKNKMESAKNTIERIYEEAENEL